MSFNIDTEVKVINIVADVIKISRKKINLDSDIDNTKGWDSLVTINIIMAIEEEFNIRIDPDDFEKITSIKNICNLIESFK